MKQFIRVMLSSGHIEEGIIEEWCYREICDDSYWLVISSKNLSEKKIMINRKYIVEYNIEELQNKSFIHVEEKNKVNIHANKNNSLDIDLIEKIRNIAEQKRAEEDRLRKEVSEQYSENVYAPNISLLKK